MTHAAHLTASDSASSRDRRPAPKPHAERFGTLIAPHLDDAYSVAHYLLRDEHDAQDVVQDAALRAFRYLDGFRDGDPRAWFLAIVRNCCFTWQRRHRNDRMTTPLDVEDASAVRSTSETDALAIEESNRAAINRAVAELPFEFREVIVLREIHDMPYAEISAVIGIPIGTVMSRLSRARRRLATILGAAEEL